MESTGSTLHRIAPVLMSLINNPEEPYIKLLDVKAGLEAASSAEVQLAQKYIVGALNAFLEKSRNRIGNKTKSAITLLLGVLFKKSCVDELKVFLFAYKYLLDVIYDLRKPNCVAAIDEEYKLEVMNSTVLLFQALTWDILEKIYDKEKAMVLSQMIYVALEMAKSEQYRALRVASIACIMSLSRVDDKSDFTDLTLRNCIADIFILFLPGITSSLAKIANEDEKQGHIVAEIAIKAWGRIVTLQMQNYNAVDQQPFSKFDVTSQTEALGAPKTKWESLDDVKSYLSNSKRTALWYKETDEKLQIIMSSFSKVTHHSNIKVRRQFLETCLLLSENCSVTIPKTVGSGINHLITLTEDEDNEISELSLVNLEKLSHKLSEDAFTNLFQNLEENFYVSVMALPRVFNSLDEHEQLSAINLIVGHIKVFGKTKLAQVLHLPFQVNHLLQGLIHISKIDTKDIQFDCEYTVDDIADSDGGSGTPWKNFRYFHKDTIQHKVEQTCALLTICDAFDVASDLLTERFINCLEDRKEATLLLNEVITGLTVIETDMESSSIVESILDLYMDTTYRNLPLEVTVDNVLSQVKENIVQICLQLEGVGKIAIVMQQRFENKMLKTLYPIFELAGSKHFLIRKASTSAILNISKACGYSGIYELINKNLDYLTYHILRKLHKQDEIDSALKALATVLKYSDLNILNYFIGDLLHSCDKYFRQQSIDSYLHIFHMVIKSIQRSLDIKVILEPIKSKKQKELEHEPFRISTEPEEANDDWETEPPDDKKVPPLHVKLTEELLLRCVHFLPSKNRTVKILVIEIFKDGIEVLRDWDDNMLPLVHQVWSPLVDRFKEQEDFVLLNYSFQLLMVLARLSKDFIRSRAAKDALPRIRQVLTTLIKSSYHQDRGSAYRFTQAYKLQLYVLPNLGRVLIDLDVLDKDIVETMKTVFPYLNKYQPIPIQESTLTFFSDLIKFDSQLVAATLKDLSKTNESLNYEKNINILLSLSTRDNT